METFVQLRLTVPTADAEILRQSVRLMSGGELTLLEFFERQLYHFVSQFGPSAQGIILEVGQE